MIPLIVGGALAGGSMLANAYESYQNRKAARDAYNRINDLANSAVSANDADIDTYERLMQDTYGGGAQNYGSALDRFLNSEVYAPKDFTAKGEISDYLDPFVNQRVNAAMEAVNNASASGGNRFSSDYIRQISGVQQARAQEAWEASYNKLMADRNQQLAEWQANTQNGWNKYNANQAQLQAAVNAYGNDRDQLTQGLGDATMARMNNRLGGLQTQASVLAGKANSQQSSPISSALNVGANFLGSYFGAK